MVIELRNKSWCCVSGTPVQPVVLRPCSIRNTDGKYHKTGVDTQTWTWNQNLNLFCLYWLTMAQPRNAFEVIW